jgi:hypothetical protein
MAVLAAAIELDLPEDLKHDAKYAIQIMSKAANEMGLPPSPVDAQTNRVLREVTS